MRSHVGMAISILAALSFAGCLEDPAFVPVDGTDASSPGDQNTTAPPPSDDTGGAPEQDNQTGNETVDPNTPPVANLTADILSGEAPLSVTFAINGSDADGDALSWNLSLDGEELGNGTEVPGSIGHTFETPGSFLVVLRLTDGEDVATANVTVQVAEPAGPIYDETHAWLVGVTEAAGLPDFFLCDSGPHAGVTHAVFELPEEAWGRPFTATLSATPGVEAVVEWGMYIQESSSCDGSVLEFFGEAAAPVGGGVDGAVTGTVPEGGDHVFVYATGGADFSLRFVVA